MSGYDLKNIPSDNLRDYIGYCPQKIQLFTGSILENIGTGIEGITEEDIIESAKLSCAHDFIVKMPGGYNYQLVDAGGNLSGGQRQAIALCERLEKPSILVLDEPTGSMDGATEERIINNILSLPYKPTIIMSAHGTNHLARVDKIGYY